MLYITTKDKNAVHTAYTALHNDFPSAGGCFAPFHLPEYSAEEIRLLKTKSFGIIVSEIINLFFGSQLTSWDIDFTLGRGVIKLKAAGAKTYLAQLWHNTDGQYQSLVNALYEKIRDQKIPGKPTLWFSATVRIAVLFALYAALDEAGGVGINQLMDVCVTSNDLTAAIAAYYAKKMGLPIGTVVLSCDEDSALWELLYRGIRQKTKALPREFELLLHALLDYDGLQECLVNKAGEGSAMIPEELLEQVKSSLHISAVGQKRIDSIISSAYITNNCIFHPLAAMAYGGLQDYRATGGESRMALIIEDVSALQANERVESVLSISQREISERI